MRARARVQFAYPCTVCNRRSRQSAFRFRFARVQSTSRSTTTGPNRASFPPSDHTASRHVRRRAQAVPADRVELFLRTGKSTHRHYVCIFRVTSVFNESFFFSYMYITAVSAAIVFSPPDTVLAITIRLPDVLFRRYLLPGDNRAL